MKTFSPELKKGGVELLILALVEARPRHGYEIGKLIEARSHGELSFRVHTLYPTLCRMENSGWLRSRIVEKAGERRRRVYRITPAGRKRLTEQRETWRRYTAAVNNIVGIEHV